MRRAPAFLRPGGYRNTYLVTRTGFARLLIEDAGRCPTWVNSGKAQGEQITSGLPATADIERTFRDVRVVP